MRRPALAVGAVLIVPGCLGILSTCGVLPVPVGGLMLPPVPVGVGAWLI